MAFTTKELGKALIAGVVVIGTVGLIAHRIHSASPDVAVAPPPAQVQPTPAAPTPPPVSAAPSCFTADQAASEENQTGCVQFVGYAYTSSSGAMYLDQSTSAPYGFSAYIPAGSAFGSTVLNQYSGTTVDVTGAITNYRGEPEIEVTNASQIHAAQ